MIRKDWRSQIFEKKKIVAWILGEGAKIVPETKFFIIFSSLVT